MNNEILKTSIEAVIKQNGNQEITGDILQQALIGIINQFGSGSVFAGFAVPTTNPINTDVNMFYMAKTPGTYTNFGGYILGDEKIIIFNNKTGVWVAEDFVNLNSDANFTPLVTKWDGENFLFLDSNKNIEINTEIKNSYLIVTQDSVGGKTVTVEGLQLDINLNPNEKTLIGYILIGSSLTFSINKNLTQTIVNVPVIPTFTTMSGVSSLSPGVLKFEGPTGSMAVSNEKLIGDGYVDFGTNVTNAIGFGFDLDNTLELNDAPYKLDYALIYNNSLYFGADGGSSVNVIGSIEGSTVVRLQRTGTLVKVSKSSDGVSFTDIYVFPSPLSGQAYIKVMQMSPAVVQTEFIKLVNQ